MAGKQQRKRDILAKSIVKPFSTLFHGRQSGQTPLLQASRTPSPQNTDDPSPYITSIYPAPPAHSTVTEAARNARTAWHGLKMVIDKAEKFVDGTVLKIPFSVFNTLISTADEVMDNQESMEDLLLSIAERLSIAIKSLDLQCSEASSRLFIEVLTAESAKIEQMKAEGILRQILESKEHPKEIEGIFKKVESATINFQLEQNLGILRQSQMIKKDTEILRLQSLKPSQDRIYANVDYEPCTPGTREHVLEDILAWCRDSTPQSPTVYWLSGMAGCGKSTIAYTLCQRLYHYGDLTGRLGASFFCSRREESGRRRAHILATVAHGLAHSIPPFGHAFLEAGCDINVPPLDERVEKFIAGPWKASKEQRGDLPPLVIVIDALDEIEKEDGSRFLEELLQCINDDPTAFQGLKFFVTSRRDPAVEAVCNSLTSEGVYRLEDVPLNDVTTDISLFLCQSLPRLDPAQLNDVAEQAFGLFIYAATAVRYIRPPSRTTSLVTQQERLDILLKGWPDSSEVGDNGLMVDRLYEGVLLDILYNEDMSIKDRQKTLETLFTIICAQEPLSVSDVSSFLGRTDIDVEFIIHAFHAVIFIVDDRVHTYHKSFTDFLLDTTRIRDQKLVEHTLAAAATAHSNIASFCFHTMESLHFDICNLPFTFIEDSDVPHASIWPKDRISFPLRYACQYWNLHLASSPQSTRLMRQLEHWLEKQLLFWAEAIHMLQIPSMVLPALSDAHIWIVKGSLTPGEWGSLAYSTSPTAFIPCIFRKALQLTNSPLFNLRAGLQCMALLNGIPEGFSTASEDVLLLYRHVLDIIPEAIWLGYDIYKRYINISEVGDAFRAATAAALSAGDVSLALEWFEQGRTVLLSQISNLKAPFNILQEVHPGLAVNIKDSATALEKSGHELHFAQTSDTNDKAPLQQEGDNLLCLAAEYRKLLADVRQLPGFENFLQPKTLKELAPAASDGPVVCINLCGSRSDALILYQSALAGPIIEYVPLPKLNPYRAKQLCKQLNKFVVPQNPRRAFRVNADIVERNKNLFDVQKSLWDFIVEPLLDRVHSMNKVYSTDIPHITWCTTGALTFLPLHAAAKDTLFAYDIVVSSYTPNLTTILPVPEKTQTIHNPSILIMASGNGDHSLPGAEQEAFNVAGHFPHSSTLLVNEDGTYNTVLNATQRHSWIHFACHGEQDPTLVPVVKQHNSVCPYHPTIYSYDDHTGFASMRNSFILHDRELPLKDLLAYSATNAEFAFLSACGTVYKNAEIPHEAVHLAAGMLSSGYRSVVATMGMIDDDDGPLIADAFYKALLKDPGQHKLNVSFRTRVACALNTAVQELRKNPKYSGEGIGRLIPFAHFG